MRPLLSQHCFSCHAKGQAKRGLNLADRKGLLAGGEGGAVVSLRAERQPADRGGRGRDGLQMPPNSQLSDAEVSVLKRWIELGGPWPDAIAGTARTSGIVTAEAWFWAFQPVKPVSLPRVQDSAWVRRPLDRFVLAALEAQGLRPVEEADRRTFVRRATFDLTGLPPSPEGGSRRSWRTGLPMPTHGSSTGCWRRRNMVSGGAGPGSTSPAMAKTRPTPSEARTYPNGYRYRDWVVAAFNADLPYDRFVMEQIAGDLLPDSDKAPEDRKERSAALGYFALGLCTTKDAGADGKAESDELDDRIDTLSRGFLGLTVSCAGATITRFDPISTNDYASPASSPARVPESPARSRRHCPPL